MSDLIDENGNPNDANIKVLREKAERADTLASENDQLKRQLAVRDSKIDTSKATYKLFEKAYDGEWTPEALDKAGEEYGLLKSDAPTPPAPGNQPTPPAGQQGTEPTDGMEFSDEQLAWMRTNGMIPEEQLTGPSPAGDIFQQQAAAASRMDAAQAGGQVQAPGQLSPTEWQQAKSPDEMLARYRAAGGTVVSSE